MLLSKFCTLLRKFEIELIQSGFPKSNFKDFEIRGRLSLLVNKLSWISVFSVQVCYRNQIPNLCLFWFSTSRCPVSLPRGLPNSIDWGKDELSPDHFHITCLKLDVHMSKILWKKVLYLLKRHFLAKWMSSDF